MANLTIKDLVESKELDSKAMAGVFGGDGETFNNFQISNPSLVSAFGDVFNITPQSNATLNIPTDNYYVFEGYGYGSEK